MITYDHAEAWKLWTSGKFASRVELAAHLGTSRQTLTHSLKMFGFKTPERTPFQGIPPKCIYCGTTIPRLDGERCSDWRRRKRCPACREAKIKACQVGEPIERHYIDPGLMIEQLQASPHPPGTGELTWQSMALFINVRQCERPVIKVWFGNVMA